MNAKCEIKSLKTSVNSLPELGLDSYDASEHAKLSIPGIRRGLGSSSTASNNGFECEKIMGRGRDKSRSSRIPARMTAAQDWECAPVMAVVISYK